MPYNTSAVYIEDDKLARETLAKRLASAQPRSRGCWSGVRLKLPLTNQVFAPVGPVNWALAATVHGKWPAHHACSVGVPDSDSLHAERQALEQMATAVGAQGFNRANTHGALSGAALAARGINTVKIYTDLPACASCRNWLTSLAGNNITIRHVFSGLFEDYYNGGDKDAMWEKFLKDYVPGA